MRKITLIGLVVVVGGLFVYNGHKTEVGYVLAWEDNFDAREIDDSKWTIIEGNGCPKLCGWGNNERQFYTRDNRNIRLKNGLLILEAHKEADDVYTSARIATKQKADWQYGKIEMKAKLPAGIGTWPAFWMLPTKKDGNVKWPDDGEIDIMEHVGYNQGMIYGTIHTARYNHIEGTQKSDSLFIPDVHHAFHTYGIEWSPQKISWYVDDVIYLTLFKDQDDYLGWPFDEHPYHIIVNLAVGGNWGGKHGIDPDIWPQKLLIDYIRYYKLKE